MAANPPVHPSNLPDRQNNRELISRLRNYVRCRLNYPEDTDPLIIDADLVQFLEDVEWDTQKLENLVKELENKAPQT